MNESLDHLESKMNTAHNATPNANPQSIDTTDVEQKVMEQVNEQLNSVEKDLEEEIQDFIIKVTGILNTQASQISGHLQDIDARITSIEQEGPRGGEERGYESLEQLTNRILLDEVLKTVRQSSRRGDVDQNKLK